MRTYWGGATDDEGSPPYWPFRQEIAVLVSHGLTSRQIAAATHISERTAENHVQYILGKRVRQPHADRRVGRGGARGDEYRS
jgi:hypothetical protein